MMIAMALIQMIFSEPFLEAVPTIHILLGIFMRGPHVFGGLEHEKNFLGIQKKTMFLTTFGLSVFSGSLGMAKFLKFGPCQIVPSQKYHFGFFLVFMSIASTLIGKGCVLAFVFVVRGGRRNYVNKCIIWMCSCLLPQLVFVSIYLPS